jgi:hypothetical protein
MGDNFLKQQVRNFTKGQDRAMSELSRRSLFDRPEFVTVAYPVSEVNGHSITVGEHLLALPSRDEGQIDFVLGNHLVGRSEGEAARALRAVLAGQDGLGGVMVEVVSKSELSGVAQVHIKDGDSR